MSAGTVVTAPGTFESTGNAGFPGQTIDYRLSVSQHGTDLKAAFYYEERASPQDTSVSGTSEEGANYGNVHPGWFCFVEKPGIYWFFDGRDSVRLDSTGPDAGPSKSIIQGNYVDRENPKIPEALLTRLPAAVSELLSPPSGKDRPSF